MKRFLSILALTAPLALGAGAQQAKADDKPAPLVVAVVDGGKLTQGAKAMKAAQDEAEKLAKRFDADFAAEQKKLQGEYQQLEKDRLKITGQEYDQRLQRLNTRFAEVRRTAQIRQEQMSRAVRAVQLQFRSEVVKVIQALSVEAGYTLVIEKSGVLHSAAQLDITDKVLERLDKAQIQVKFEFPPKAEATPAPADKKPAAPGAPKKTN
ncbi:MAG TPA: OmpH family outer membrane protein [Alphaproteobacteria bacterium]|jgi:Skp family chaperone for outer membrane proteins